MFESKLAEKFLASEDVRTGVCFILKILSLGFIKKIVDELILNEIYSKTEFRTMFTDVLSTYTLFLFEPTRFGFIYTDFPGECLLFSIFL